MVQLAVNGNDWLVTVDPAPTRFNNVCMFSANHMQKMQKKLQVVFFFNKVF